MANSPILAIPLLSVSQAAKETTINTMVSYLERAMNDSIAINFAGGNYTLPLADLQRYFNFSLVGGGATSTLNITATKRMFALNNLANGSAVTLNCGTDSMTIPAGGIVLVLCDGFNLISVADSTIMGGGAGGVTTFLGLSDVPSSYAGVGKFGVRVKEDLTGLEFHAFNIADMADVDLTGIADGYTLEWDTATSKWIAVAPSGGGGSSSPYWKNPCVVATTANVDLNLDLSSGTMLDGVVLSTGWRVLVKNQTTASENGIYIVQAGPATRATDADEDSEFPQGAAVAVVLGIVNGGTVFLQTEDPVVVGTTPINFKTKSFSLAAMSDVDVTTTPPTDNQVLKYDAATQTWIPGDDAGGASYSLASLTDVDMDPAPNDGQVLTWVAADGVARFLEGGGGGSGDLVLAVFAAGTLDNSELILAHDVVTPFSLTSYTDSRATATNVSTGNVAFTIKKNGTSIGTITFNTSSLGVFAGAGDTFVVGDKLTIEAPATADATLQNVSISLKGVR